MPNRQPRNHHEPPESQWSGHIIAIRCHQTCRSGHQNHGPNRKTKPENRSSPHQHRSWCIPQLQSHNKPAEYQQSANASKAGHRRTRHSSAQIHRLSWKPHNETGISPPLLSSAHMEFESVMTIDVATGGRSLQTSRPFHRQTGTYRPGFNNEFILLRTDLDYSSPHFAWRLHTAPRNPE